MLCCSTRSLANYAVVDVGVLNHLAAKWPEHAACYYPSEYGTHDAMECKHFLKGRSTAKMLNIEFSQ